METYTEINFYLSNVHTNLLRYNLIPPNIGLY